MARTDAKKTRMPKTQMLGERASSALVQVRQVERWRSGGVVLATMPQPATGRTLHMKDVLTNLHVLMLAVIVIAGHAAVVQ
jgi:hypothetical protein